MLGSGEVQAGRWGYGRAMERRANPGRLMIEAAALAKIDELAGAGYSEHRRS
jgi:hypothetical protein